jgi:hypothetical protein
MHAVEQAFADGGSQQSVALEARLAVEKRQTVTLTPLRMARRNRA